MNQKIEINQLWKHKNGHVYRILYVTNEHADQSKVDEYPVTIVYTRHIEPDGKIWSKRMDLFLENRVYYGLYTPQKWKPSTRYKFRDL